MRISRILTFAIAAFAMNAATVSTDAFAKKGKDKAAQGDDGAMLEIKETKSSAFDDVFTKVSDVQTRLKETNDNLIKANDSITTALGLPQGTPVADAIADLKTKGGEHLKLTMAGDKPSLTVADAAPQNVKDAVTATNDAVTLWVSSVDTMAKINADIQVLVGEAQALPGKVPDAAKELAPGDALKLPKLVSHNVKATQQTGDMAKTVADSLVTNMQTVKSFGQ